MEYQIWDSLYSSNLLMNFWSSPNIYNSLIHFVRGQVNKEVPIVHLTAGHWIYYTKKPEYYLSTREHFRSHFLSPLTNLGSDIVVVCDFITEATPHAIRNCPTNIPVRSLGELLEEVVGDL